MFKLTKTLVVTSILAAAVTTGCVSDIVAPVATESTSTTPVANTKPRPFEGAVEVGSGVTYPLPVIHPSVFDLTGDGSIDAGDLAVFARILGADTNHDGAVSEADSKLMAESLGLVAPPGAIETLDAKQLALLARVRACDFTHDGRVDMGDFAAFAAIYDLRSSGDFNRDGVVNAVDSTELVRHIGHEVTPAGTACGRIPADLTGDGRVDAADLASFAQAQRAELTGDGKVDTADQALVYAVLGQKVPQITDAASIARAAQIMAADFDGNGIVDQADVARFAYLLGLAGIADVNEDGLVNAADVEVIRKSLNEVSPCA
jgi:hypothetical protein